MTKITRLPPGSGLEPAEVLARARSNFGIGFVCLDAERRAGMTAIYAFCRVADDAADDTPDAATGAEHLQFWRDELHAAANDDAKTPVGRALAHAMKRYGMPVLPLEALLDGVAMDLSPQPFRDEAELRHYCDCVASAVGRACLPVLGAEGPVAVRFADALGQALQITNILRDLRSDAEAGRIYVPVTWLREHRVESVWLRGGGPELVYKDGGPIARLRAQLVDVARAEFATARSALLALPRTQRRALVPARIMGAVYHELLHRLAGKRGALGAERVRVPKAWKIWLALQVFAGWKA